MADDLTIQAGVRTGGGATPNIGADLPQDRTSETLQTLKGFSKLAGSILAPIVEREKNAAYVEGVTEVMRGRTTDEIAAEQPKWARVFGDNYAVQGARMQEAASVGTRFLSRVQTQMPELRKLTQDGFSRYVADAMEADLPTDPQAALLAKQRILQSLPELTGQWSRANVQYGQEQALVQHTEAIGAAVGLLKTGEEAARLNPAVMDPTLDDKAWGQFQAAMTAPIGVDAAVHDKVVNRAIIGALGTPGGVALYATLQKRGMWDTLPQDVQDRGITNARQQAGQMVRAGEVPPELAQEAAALRVNAAQYTTEEVTTRMLDINKRVSAYTGIPRELYTMFTGPEQEQVLKERESRLRTLREAAERKETREALARLAQAQQAQTAWLKGQKARDKAEGERNDLLSAQAAFNLTGPGAAGEQLASLPVKARNFAVQAVVSGTDPHGFPVGSTKWSTAVANRAEMYTRMLGDSSLPTPALVRDSIQVPLSQQEFGADVQTAVATATAIKDPATRAKVLKADMARLVDTYNSLYQGAISVDPRTGATVLPKDTQAIWTAARVRAERVSITGGEEGKALAQELSVEAGFSSGDMGGELKKAYDHAPAMPEEARRKFAIAEVQHKAYPLGGLTVLRERDSHDQPEDGFGGLTGKMAMSQQGRTLPALVSAIGKGLGASEPPVVVRGANISGLARFILVYSTPSGTQYRTVTGDDVRAAAESELISSKLSVLPRSGPQRGRAPRPAIR